MPTDDVSALMAADYAADLRQSCDFPEVAPDLVHRLAHKGRLYGACQELGLPAPRTEFPSTLDDLPVLGESLGYPLVVKAMDPLVMRGRPGSRSVSIARSLAELEALYDHIDWPQQTNLMLQEYIPGGADSVWMVNAYADTESRCRIVIAGQKVRQAPPQTGMTTLGVCRTHAVVEGLTRHLAASTCYRGVLDIGFRYDSRDGLYKILDVNPRIGSTFRLFVDDSGFDVVRAQHDDSLGGVRQQNGVRQGRRWIVEDEDILTCPDSHRAGSLTFGSYRSSLYGLEEGAWFAVDDPAPFLRMSMRVGRTVLRVSSRRARRTMHTGKTVVEKPTG